MPIDARVATFTQHNESWQVGILSAHAMTDQALREGLTNCDDPVWVAACETVPY